MKKILLGCACICLLNNAEAQNTSGKISYTETIKMNIDLGGDIDVQATGDAVDAEQIRRMLPKERHVKKVLYYTADASLYTTDKSQAKEDHSYNQNNGNVQMMVQIDIPEDITYTSMKDNKQVEQRDFMGRKFLITSDVEKSKWKLTGKQKTILNYPCQEAMMATKKDTITAWFTAAIPVSAGPQSIAGLPGMILEATQNKDLILKADAVTFGDESQNIVKPKEGKKVTEEEFRAIVEKKTKEMAEEFGGSGNHVIIKMDH